MQDRNPVEYNRSALGGACSGGSTLVGGACSGGCLLFEGVPAPGGIPACTEANPPL